MSTTPKLIIIGAGISGLSAGVHAARCGLEVEIVEHHSEPGGVCTGWKHGDYTIDGCIHWLIGAREDDDLHRLYQKVGALDGVELRPLDHYVQLVDESNGQSLSFDRNLDHLLAQVEAMAPGDLPVFRELVELARRSESIPMISMIDAPEARSTWANIVALWHARERLTALFRHIEPLAELAARVEHPTSKYALERMMPADMPVSFMAMVLGELERGNLATVVGGSQRFSQAMARKFVELGGKLRYQADVAEILVEDDRAVGVRLIDGERLRADHVISTAPGPTTVFRMLAGRYTDAKLRERYARWPKFGPICMLSFGLRAQWHDRPHALHLRLAEPFVFGPTRVEALTVRNMVYDPSLAPPGASVIQVLHESDFDFWHDLHHAPQRYHELKRALAAVVRSRLERYYPGFAAAEEFVDVATPYTFWRYARSYRGAYEGWLPTHDAVRTHLPKTLPGLRRFHMAGQWVEPGGGVPPAVTSGRQAVQMLCEEHELAFVD
ncbi:phytoene desaturase family protein [Nannocystaceae bacterium ST9]